MKLTWDLDKSAIMLGIDYIGDLDDLRICSESLSAEAILSLPRLRKEIGTLDRRRTSSVGRASGRADSQSVDFCRSISSSTEHAVQGKKMLGRKMKR